VSKKKNVLETVPFESYVGKGPKEKNRAQTAKRGEVHPPKADRNKGTGKPEKRRGGSALTVAAGEKKEGKERKARTKPTRTSSHQSAPRRQFRARKSTSDERLDNTKNIDQKGPQKGAPSPNRPSWGTQPRNERETKGRQKN